MFVGTARHGILRQLLDSWQQVVSEGTPQLVLLEGEPGYGKTHLIHQFYRALAAEQKPPGYWPETIDRGGPAQPLSMSLLNTRKLVKPENFEIPGTAPEYLWIGTVLADSHEIHADFGLDDIIGQLSFHLAPLMRKKKFRAQIRKVATSAAGLIPLLEALELATDIYVLMNQTAELFKRTSSGGRMTRNAGYEERLAAFYRFARLIWGQEGDKGPPVIVAIEDFHAAQEPTIAFVRQILGGANLPFLMIGCCQRPALQAAGLIQQLKDATPARIRSISVEKLETTDVVTVARDLLPATPHHLLQLLAERADGNVYTLKLQVLGLSARIKDGCLIATAREIERLPIETDQILLALWHQLPSDHQRVLGFMALTGHQAPEWVDQQVLAAVGHLHHRPGGQTNWVLYSAENRVFVEVARWQLARQRSEPLLTATERRQAVAVGMDAVVEQLGTSEGNRLANRSLLRSCLENLLPEALRQRLEFDRLTVAGELTEWVQTLHWSRLHEAALQVLSLAEQTLDHHSVRKDPLGLSLRSACFRLRCSATRLLPGHGFGHPASIESAENFLDWAESVQSRHPQARVQAHAAMSRACRMPDNATGVLVLRSKRELNEAQRLFAELTPADVTTEIDLMSATYPWLARAGQFKEAAAAAARVARLAQGLLGEDHPRVDMAMHDAAFYTRRVDPAAGVQAYRALLAVRLRRWGDASHPVVAVQMKDLASALLGQADETSVREASSLLETAYASLLHRSGPEGRDTAVTESVLALCLVRLAPFLPESEAKPTRQRALRLAAESLQLRRAGRPTGKHLPQRATLAYAQLANSDPAGFTDLEEILADRSSRHEEPYRVAELRWQAAHMAEEYLRWGNPVRARELVKEFRLPEPA